VSPAATLVVIGGTTASGKSALALRLAERTGGVIVNADSMQLYRDLRILTARPSAEDEARAEHRLYGVLDAAESGSAGLWLSLVAPIIARSMAAGRTVIVVGGTGLYIQALLQGLAPVPDVPAEVRLRLRAEAQRLPPAELHRRLAARDPRMARMLRPSDPQRILRALEVLEGTGRSLADWHTDPRVRVELPPRRVGLALLPPPAAVSRRITARLDDMAAAGALAEVERLTARTDVPPDSPLLRATGVPELLGVLEGRSGLAEALAEAALRTRQYAKRQRTFFRHRLPELRHSDAFGETWDDSAIDRLAPPPAG
jgi:tRNA dimethylallyltransferase